jgi:CobQ-like glutamine amidotransferase family enzyme
VSTDGAGRADHLIIGWLYPDLMNIYGDRGNILTLVSRARWRGIDVEVRPTGLGPVVGLEDANLLFFGGGQDREQELVFADLESHKTALLQDALGRDVPVLAVCGGYQLVGHYYETADGTKLPGLGLLDISTDAGESRAIGDIVLEADPELGLEPSTLVGFENHSGRTHLGPGARPLGRVRAGHGNNGKDGTEGARQGSLVGTYLHGSLLPKNPQLADLVLSRALGRPLAALDDDLELAAHRRVAERTLARA